MTNGIRVLLAVRDGHAADRLRFEMDDGEHCIFDVVTDGYAAMASAARCLPDILVIDAALPGMDGPRTVDCMKAALGMHMPRVIGSSMRGFADAAWKMRGIEAVVHGQISSDLIRDALNDQIDHLSADIDWAHAEDIRVHARTLLMQMGMDVSLKGCTYLSYAAALAYEYEPRLRAVGERLYRPIADHFSASPASVERLIRHAVERTMDTIGAQGVYQFFGNTIDPMRGKPTNAQMIALLAERMRVEKTGEYQGKQSGFEYGETSFQR